MKVSISPILGFCCRLLWVVLTIINWIIYIPTFFIIIVFEIVFMIFRPVVWVFCGKTITEKIYDAVFKHSNQKLWLVEEWDYNYPGTFESMIPIYGKYIQEYIDLILSKNDN